MVCAIQTVVCIPVLDGVVELGTTDKVNPASPLSRNLSWTNGYLIIFMSYFFLNTSKFLTLI